MQNIENRSINHSKREFLKNIGYLAAGTVILTGSWYDDVKNTQPSIRKFKEEVVNINQSNMRELPDLLGVIVGGGFIGVGGGYIIDSMITNNRKPESDKT